MKKHKIDVIIYVLLIILFSVSIVNKVFENDTYFAIAVGNKILKEGFFTDETFVFVEGLKYQNVRWVFDIIMVFIYNNFNYLGIYIFVMVVTAIIAVSIYYILLKNKCPKLIAFFITIVSVYCANNVFVPRAQILSFLIFIWEYYFIQQLLRTRKKRYIACLFVLSVLLANTHASVFPLYFVIFLPFIAEEILARMKFLPKNDSKLIIEDRNCLEILVIAFAIAFLGGLITPIGFAPYINIFKTVGEVSSDFISEMAPIIPALRPESTYFLIIFAGIVGFSKAKVKLSDALILFGFSLLSFSNIRSVYFLLLIGAFSIGNILTDFYNEYELYKVEIKDKKIYYGLCSAGALIIIVFSISSLFANLQSDYENPNLCPIGVVKYIKENFSEDEISKMRLYNGFNFGSYLEFNNIPVFMDSRAEIYLDKFNNTSIIKDFLLLTNGSVHYNNIFEKYDINYVLLENNSIIINYIYEDKYWNLLYQDNYYSFYERVN